MKDILVITQDILAVNKEHDNCVETISKLLDKRGAKLKGLEGVDIEKGKLDSRQKKAFRTFFSKYAKLDQEMNQFLTELSLSLKGSIQALQKDKNINQEYAKHTSTGQFLDTQITT